MTTPIGVQPQQMPRAELVTIETKDVPEVASFIATQSGRSRDTVEAHLRWFLLENPALRAEDPLGFGLRSADRIVGCILCSPQFFRCEKQTILFMGSSLFYVDDRHRGYGGRIFLQYCRLGNRYPLFGTSANAEAAALWKAAGASPIPYSDGELFGVLRWPPIAEEVAHRRYSNRLLTALVGSSVAAIAGVFCPLKIDCSSSDELQTLTSAEQASDLLQRHHFSTKLTAARDLPYLRWRYFPGRDVTVAAFAFRSDDSDHDVFVAVNQRIRGYRQQIKTLNVLDVYPEVSQAEWLQIVGALIACYREKVDAIVLRSQNLEQRKMFCGRGFQWRAFDAPIGWFLDRSRMLPTHDWYPVPADGDGLI
ncbi:MAG: hypothetical protein WAN65_03465 [Candidatus Sulfotelmatobacter sp.]